MSHEPSSDVSELERLRFDLEALRAEISCGVRTRQVTVVDGVGVPRIVLSADSATQIALRARTSNRGEVMIALVALDASELDDAIVGLELIDAGNVTGGWHLTPGRPPHQFTDPQPGT